MVLPGSLLLFSGMLARRDVQWEFSIWRFHARQVEQRLLFWPTRRLRLGYVKGYQA